MEFENYGSDNNHLRLVSKYKNATFTICWHHGLKLWMAEVEKDDIKGITRGIWEFTKTIEEAKKWCEERVV